MSELNMMPLLTDAYLADTTHLSLEEHGAYLKLLMVMWRNGGWLPNDDQMVCRYLSITMNKWKKLKPVIAQFFTYEINRFTQKKLQKIFIAKSNLVKQNRENGSKGGKYKSLKNKKLDLANATNSLDDSLKRNDSESLAYQKPETRNNKHPTSLPSSRARENGIGVFKKSERGGDSRSFDVTLLLSDSGFAAARKSAPGWDIYHLASIYNEGIQKRGIPNNPDKAFPAWCLVYTKGNPP